jgi:hypothetical protein
MVLRMSDHEFKTALHKAHVDGNGAAVAEIWRKIADGEMSDADTLAWAKEVAVWITSTDYPSRETSLSGEAITPVKQSKPVPRVARIHAALTVTGWAEPALDSLTDEFHILQLAKEGLRPAATIIWWLLAKGNASQGTREEWLDHVAAGVDKENQLNREKRRGDYMLGPLGLAGHALADDKALVLLACRVMFNFPTVMYSDDPRKYVSELMQRLQDTGLMKITTHRENVDWQQYIRRELRKNPPPA